MASRYKSGPSFSPVVVSLAVDVRADGTVHVAVYDEPGAGRSNKPPVLKFAQRAASAVVLEEAIRSALSEVWSRLPNFGRAE